MSISLSFRTEEDKRAQLDQLADTLDRNRNWVINEAIDAYLDLHKWQLEEIEKGIAATDVGRSYTHEQMKVYVAKFSAKSKTKAKAQK